MTQNATSEKGSAQPVADQGCNTATGTTVAQEPDSVPKMSHNYRSQHVNHDPGQHKLEAHAALLGFVQNKAPRLVTWGFVVAGAGFEPATFGL